MAPSTLVDVVRSVTQSDPERCTYTFLRDGETDETSLSNAELDRQAQAIAAMLQSIGAVGQRALLVYPPGLEYIAAFFGCLYAGVVAVPAYTPDPRRLGRTAPRLQTIAADAQAKIALTTAALLPLREQLFVHAPALAALHWLATDDISDRAEGSWRPPELTGDSLAFLQYTSGSTGTPKGVIVSHSNLLHNLALTCGYSEASATTVCVSWLPPYHDMGLIACILATLSVGCRTILMSPIAFLQRPGRWLAAISRYGGTIAGAPNFAYDLCVRKVTEEERAALNLGGWEHAVCAAEPIRFETLERFVATFGPCGFRREAFHPCYGLAEATLVVSGVRNSSAPTLKTLRSADLERLRVVEAAARDAGTRTVVGCSRPAERVVAVDPESLTVRAADEVGEIWVAGPSIAQGYWNRPEETAHTFHAYLRDSGEGPFLRTGDLGFLSDGELFVTGRLKDLLIIRGRNLYPEDIEHTVETCHAALRPGCGAAFSIEVDGEERLVVVSEVDTRRPVDAGAVLARIREAVAQTHEVAVHAAALLRPGTIPKTSSGKIQRHACRADFLAGTLEVLTQWQGDETRADDPPTLQPSDGSQSPERIEAWLIAQLAEELKLDAAMIDRGLPVARYGVDSLSAVALSFRVETELGVAATPGHFLGDLSVAELAIAFLADRREAVSPPRRQAVYSLPAPTEHPLSHGQRGLWFLHQLAPGSAAYHIANAVRVRGALDVSALRRAFQQLVDRHPSLRTTFVARDGVPVQRIHGQQGVAFDEVDASSWSAAKLDGRLAVEADRPFDLECGPLLRIQLFRRARDEHVLLVVVHHLVADLWSLGILLQELGILYGEAAAGRAASLAPLGFQYTDYVRSEAARLAGAEGERLWRHWQRRLSGVLPSASLPTDRPRPPVQSYRGAAHAFRLERPLLEALKTLGQRRNATLYTVLLAAFQVLLHRTTHQDDILVGSPMAGRTRSEWSGIVGYFANPVVMRADLSGDPPFDALLHRVRESVLAALEHQDLPFPLLVERLRLPRAPGRSPLFQVQLVLHQPPRWQDRSIAAFSAAQPGIRIDFAGLSLEPFAVRPRSAQCDLTLALSEVDGGLSAILQYDTDLFEATTIERMAGHFETLLRGVVADPAKRISRLPVLSAGERHRLLVDWNDTAEPYPDDRCVHQLIEARVERSGDTVAVTTDGEQLTYGELNRRANQLSRYLRRVGVGPEAIVGVSVERSADMVVALLGVLKAGAAYVPLDPAYPKARLSFMLKDAGVALLLTHESLRSDLSAEAAVCLDRDWQTIARESGDDPGVPVAPDQLAYVIYTSGSTGRPKGVEVSHRALVNFLAFIRKRPGLGEHDVLLALTNLSFDIAALEIFLPLTVGARLVLTSRDVASDGALLSRAITDSGATVMQATPATWRLLLAAGWSGSRQLKALCGGEALLSPLADQLRRRTASLWNLYGPTEATIWCTVHRVESASVACPSGTVPIGRPVANTQVYLLDPGGEPVPVGSPGELHVSGVGLARGYRGRPELTSVSFVPHPFSPKLDARLYKTGDVARYLPDGTLEFLGRLDHQVKISGHRVEPAEVEAALLEHPAVRETVVVAREDRPGEKRLVAYVVAGAGRVPTVNELHVFLRGRLPEYMLPAAFVWSERLPLTPAGKVDRQALPAPDEERPLLDRAFVAPRTATERRLAQVWTEMLGIEQVGVDDDFFALGGDSLAAVRLAARISAATERDVPVKFILLHPTIAAAAEALETLRVEPRAGADAAVPRSDSPFLTIERRPLLSLFAAGKIAPVQAAAIASLPGALLRETDRSADEIIDGLCDDLPVFAGVYELPLGRIALVLLPRFDFQLYRDTADLVSVVGEALALAGRLGARTASLTGLIPSATDYGRAVVAAFAGKELPQATTGHATTAAAVVLSLRRALQQAGRDLTRERLAVLGLGSIGAAAIRLILASLPHPEEIMLCDLYQKHGWMEALGRESCNEGGFRGVPRILSSHATVPAELYEASVIIGASNVADVLDVTRVRPGTILVDDSAPHCFDVAQAIRRFEAQADILFTEGGAVRAAEPIRQLRWVPRALSDSAVRSSGTLFMQRDPHAITGCVLSSLLAASFEQLPPTLGRVDQKACLTHYTTLEQLGFAGAEVHCEGFTPSEESLRRFRSRFGR